MLPITIDKYPNGHYNRPIQGEGAPAASQSTPGTPPKPANRPARRVYHIRQPLARDKAIGPGGCEHEKKI
nr:MAG TPA: hypothetical protein [Caudoviricetes sp.]